MMGQIQYSAVFEEFRYLMLSKPEIMKCLMFPMFD